MSHAAGADRPPYMTSSSPAAPRDLDPRPPWLDDAAWAFPLRALDANGSTVVYTDVGHGPALLLVTVGMWSIVWRDVVARLSDSYRCVTLDVPGSGLSGPPASKPTLGTAAAAIDAVVRTLDLTDVTLVVHDLGAPATLEAAAQWTDRVAGLVVVNGFGWRPSGAMFRGMLAVMGSPAMRELDAFTGWLPRATATRFGVARHWDRATRTAFRLGTRRAQRRAFHEFMASARRHDYTRIDAAVAELSDRPALTIFGQRNDPLRFQPKWNDRFPAATQTTVAKGYHFPMCDNPELVATTIRDWHTRAVLPGVAARAQRHGGTSRPAIG